MTIWPTRASTDLGARPGRQYTPAWRGFGCNTEFLKEKTERSRSGTIWHEGITLWEKRCECASGSAIYTGMARLSAVSPNQSTELITIWRNGVRALKTDFTADKGPPRSCGQLIG
jgi:hypothetical protein